MRNVVQNEDIWLAHHGIYSVGQELTATEPLTGVDSHGVKIVEHGTIAKLVKCNNTVWAQIRQIIPCKTVVIDRLLGWIEVAGPRFENLIGDRPVVTAAV